MLVLRTHRTGHNETPDQSTRSSKRAEPRQNVGIEPRDGRGKPTVSPAGPVSLTGLRQGLPSNFLRDGKHEARHQQKRQGPQCEGKTSHGALRSTANRRRKEK